MLRPGNPGAAHSLLPAVSVSSGGLVPVLLLAFGFGVFGAAAGTPVALAALLGLVGGTASILIHELGHVLAARNAPGLRSASVSLRWFGAVTRFEGGHLSGGEQARVAIAGPVASFVVAASLMGTCLVPIPVHVKEAVVLLALFNLAIGAFNLLPVFPLDGHKLAVGLLWAATGSEVEARRWFRRIAIGWAALEIPAGAMLLVERPALGSLVAALAATVLLQKRLALSHSFKFSR